MKSLPAQLLVLLAVSVVAVVGGRAARAADRPLHPRFPLLDEQGVNVLTSGGAVSTMRTCGDCHDTDYIATHSYHVDAGQSLLGSGGGAPWALGPGSFGGWDPLTYRRLSGKDEERMDLGRADWLRTIGLRHAGGGPARKTKDGTRLDQLPRSEQVDPDAWTWSAESGKPERWDWKKSGIAELDCFVCHITGPAMSARREELAAGRFRWAATASLSSTGLVTRGGGSWVWKKQAFDGEGEVSPALLAKSGHALGAPTSANCGACHGPVHSGSKPLRRAALRGQPNAETRGQVFSAQRLSDSALNLQGRESLSRPFDVHAERLLHCADCHHAPNDPAYAGQAEASRPGHLTFDARRPSVGDFLKRPNHNLARGRDASLKGCVSCHEATQAHAWLPYTATHMAAMRCEVCHIPQVRAPARQATDWTMLEAPGRPRVEYRGVNGPVDEATSLVPGFQPVLLSATDPAGNARLAPYNLIAFWYWVEAEPLRPVRLADLEAALFSGDQHHPDVLAALDANGDGRIADGELKLDTPEKVAAIKARLAAVGVKDPRIEAELRPYGLHHTVVTGANATRDCSTCHTKDSRMSAPFPVASFAPGGVTPTWRGDERVAPQGTVVAASDGTLEVQPDVRPAHVYVLGHHRTAWIDILGIIAVALVVLGASGHGLLRILGARSRRAGA